jgi:hypothetical protein
LQRDKSLAKKQKFSQEFIYFCLENKNLANEKIEVS